MIIFSRYRWRHVLFGACLSIFLCLPVLAATPAAFTVEYQVFWRGSEMGVGELSFRPTDDGRYRIELSVTPTHPVLKLTGVEIEERTDGQLTKKGLQPLRYRREQSGPGGRSTALDFDWTGGVVKARHRNKANTLRLDPQALDPLSLYVQVTQDMQARRLQKTYTLVNRTRQKSYAVSNQGNERLATPLGRQNTVRIQRGEADDKRRELFWLAPELGYIPVQIVQYKDGHEEFKLTARRVLH